MFLTIRWIKQIKVTDINGEELLAKEGETFEVSNMHGQWYLNNYPQYFRTAWTAQTAQKAPETQEEEEEVILTVAQLQEAITALGAEPVKGKKADLEAQYAELQAKAEEESKLKAEEDAKTEANK